MQHNTLWSLLGDAFNVVLAHQLAEEEPQHQPAVEEVQVDNDTVLLYILKLCQCYVQALPNKKPSTASDKNGEHTDERKVSGKLTMLIGKTLMVPLTV